MRILAVDHGEKRIGVAISDETATIASPVKVVEHISRTIDAAQVADIAAQNNAGLIVVGQSYDEDGKPNPAGRRGPVRDGTRGARAVARDTPPDAETGATRRGVGFH